METIFDKEKRLKTELKENKEKQKELINTIEKYIYSGLGINYKNEPNNEAKATACKIIAEEKTWVSQFFKYFKPLYKSEAIFRLQEENKYYNEYKAWKTTDYAFQLKDINEAFTMLNINSYNQTRLLEKEIWQQEVDKGNTLLGYEKWKKYILKFNSQEKLNLLSNYFNGKVYLVNNKKLKLKNWVYLTY